MSRKTTRNALGAVEKLIEQRRLFQDWLAKLDAGVEGMPPRVVERVRNDYRGRLEKVLGELGEQQDAVREALQEAEGRHEALEAQQQEKREEMAELKLRRHVGEVEDQRFREANSSLKSAIDALSKDLAVALRDMERYEEILEIILRAEGPPAAEAAAPPAGEPPEEADEGEVILPLLEEPATDESEPEPPSAPKPEVEDELAFLRSVTTTNKPPKTSRGGAPEKARAEARAPAPPEPEPPPPPAPPEPEPEAIAVEPSMSRKSAEMQAPVIDEPPDELVAAAHMVDLPQQEEEPPPAAEEQPEVEGKGLVCAECGATNRATEWYCEKCGAELSAL